MMVCRELVLISQLEWFLVVVMSIMYFFNKYELTVAGVIYIIRIARQGIGELYNGILKKEKVQCLACAKGHK